jgi:hypothetical protein
MNDRIDGALARSHNTIGSKANILTDLHEPTQTV